MANHAFTVGDRVTVAAGLDDHGKTGTVVRFDPCGALVVVLDDRPGFERVARPENLRAA